MKTKLICLPFFLFLSVTVAGQDRDKQPPTNLRNASDHLPLQVDLMWTPPAGWIPSPVDRWFEYDRGIYGDNAIGSCPGCPVEIAIRWDSNYFSNYHALYLTKIRFALKEPALDHALRVYQVQNNIFDTLFNYPLHENLVYDRFDTLEFAPKVIDISKELWVGLWVSDLGPGYPLAVGDHPVLDGYGNMIYIYNQGYWETLMDLNPDLEYPWNIGAYFETPYDEIIYPVFNVYRSINELAFEKIHEGNFYDTVYHDYLGDLAPENVRYYVTCVYEDGESTPSDTLQLILAKTPDFDQNKYIKVYPNPATDHVSIESVKGKINSISLIDSQGSVIINRNTDNKKVDLDISNLNSSIYIIKIITEEGIFTSKLLVVK